MEMVQAARDSGICWDLMPILWTLMDFLMGFLWFLNGKLNGDFMDLADFMGGISLIGFYGDLQCWRINGLDLLHTYNISYHIYSYIFIYIIYVYIYIYVQTQLAPLVV